VGKEKLEFAHKSFGLSLPRSWIKGFHHAILRNSGGYWISECSRSPFPDSEIRQQIQSGKIIQPVALIVSCKGGSKADSASDCGRDFFPCVGCGFCFWPA
jgi:hypothetical protein